MSEETKSELVLATLMFAVALSLGFLAVQVADKAPVIAGAFAFVSGWISASSVLRAWCYKAKGGRP